ncbi:MAG: hypothetical protein ACLGI9_25860, partial [Thermoanaerobaculia bacterium]
MADERTTVNDPEPLTRPIADELSSAVAEDLESFDSVQAERDSERAFESHFEGEEEMPGNRLLSFYDRLRERILHTVERRGGRMSEGAVKALLLVPDVFILLVRLMLDKNVPGSTRAMVARIWHAEPWFIGSIFGLYLLGAAST